MVERTTPAGAEALVEYVQRELQGRTYSTDDGRAYLTDVVRIIGRQCLEARERAHELANQVMALELQLLDARAALQTSTPSP